MDDLSRIEDLKGYQQLKELALDLQWPWSHYGDQVWKLLDAELWDITQNPWAVLQTVSREKLAKALADPSFCQVIDGLVKDKARQAEMETWYQKHHQKAPLTSIAYFSMEYMLSEALPIYSGGLGNVAGDQLKAASDLGVPVTAIGLLYQQGYFRQMIDKNGVQEALYPYNDPGQLPITPVRKPNGELLRLEIVFPGWSLWIKAWEVQVGKVKLYLLDTNDIANFPVFRGITSELYGGGPELRLKQEVLLGIGGWRLLNELGIKPEVCHLNEGHAAFAILERARTFMQETGKPFEAALAATRAGNLFTTHTAVPAGFDRFSPELMAQYLTFFSKVLGLKFDDFLALGRLNPEDRNEPFNMAYLAMRGCGASNGVSQLHGAVSRTIFSTLFPRWPESEVPIGHVTNGIHVPSWDSKAANQIWTEMLGKDRWFWAFNCANNEIGRISDAKLWKMRSESRKALVVYTRKRLARQLAARGTPYEEIEQTKHLFDENILTIGFARRFATYKRPNMLLHDPARLLRILTNPQKPVQLIIAGKAHPADQPGQALIRQWMDFIQTPEARPHVVFLSDYDMMLTERMVQGVDVWINTPRRPWEACGTSGMKVLANGGLNLSELDGWWVEAYSPEVGWAMGDGKEHGADPAWDAAEANALYDLLENEVIPQFYDRDNEGMPLQWVSKIRASMGALTPHFSASRTVREYTERYYIPAAEHYLERAANQGKLSVDILNWRDLLFHDWGKIRFVDVKIENTNDHYEFLVQVYLDGLEPGAVKVELYSEDVENGAPMRHEMTLVRKLEGDPHTCVYKATVPASRSAGSYTPRVIPYFPNVAVPLEVDLISWQK